MLKKDPFGRIIQKQEMHYCPADNLISLVETIYAGVQPLREKVTQLAYDSMGQIVHIIEASNTPEQISTSFTYQAGRKIAVTKPDGVVIDYGYDDFGLMAFQKSRDGTIHDTFDYDIKGNLTLITDEIHQTHTQRDYNYSNAVVYERLATGYDSGYDYDPLGRLIKFRLFDNSSTEYIHTTPGKEELCRKDAQGNILYTYSATLDYSGNVLEETLINQAGSAQHSYSKNSQRTRSVHTQWEQQVSYDKVGNVTQTTLKDDSGEVVNTYAYDPLYQLASENGIADHRYTYDSASNRLSIDDKPQLFNALNQLIQAEDRYAYDLNGNLTQKNDITFTYDALNRLTQVTQGDTATRYIYDALNRRLCKQTLTLENGTWIPQEKVDFLYQDQNEIGLVKEGRLEELRVLNMTGKGAEIGATASIEIKGVPYAPLHDHNGNITALLDSCGQTVESYRYSAFGESASSAIGNPWRYACKRVDSETGFVFFGRRHYDPKTARWITKDPLGLKGGLNFYAYVMNNPLNHFDLYGLCAQQSAPQRAYGPSPFRRGCEGIWNGVQRGVKHCVGCAARVYCAVLPITCFPAGNERTFL